MQDDRYKFFKKTVDGLVELSENDKELSDKIKYIDELAMKNGVDFYQQVFIILYKHQTEQNAKDWVKTKY